MDLGGGKEGLLHISKISEKRIEKVEDVLKEGDKFLVKVLDIDNQGKISLTKKGLGIGIFVGLIIAFFFVMSALTLSHT